MPQAKSRSRSNARKRARGGGNSPRIRYGVVGLGWFAQVAILPAFDHASENSELVALFSDDPRKLKELGSRHEVDRLYHYDEYDEALGRGEIDAVYIAVPNHLHKEFTVRAAQAGAHVLCEKPMAVTERDCEAMIRACEKSGTKLMIAYRLHFERGNLEAAELVGSGKLGEPRLYSSVFVNSVADEDNIRLGPIEQGGGTVYDIGIYCINAARSVFRAEPVEVRALSANNGEKRFRQVDEMTSAVLKFPGERLAVFTSGFGASPHHHYEVHGTKGSLRVEPAFEFAEEIGVEIRIGEKKQEKKFARRDQIAPEILYFSDCIRRNREPEPSGREGLADVRVIRAIYRSARSGRAVSLPPFSKRTRPALTQERRRPPVAHQDLVGVDSPSGG